MAAGGGGGWYGMMAAFRGQRGRQNASEEGCHRDCQRLDRALRVMFWWLVLLDAVALAALLVAGMVLIPLVVMVFCGVLPAALLVQQAQTRTHQYPIRSALSLLALMVPIAHVSVVAFARRRVIRMTTETSMEA